MTIDPENPKHLIADENKVLVQLSSGLIMGTEVWLKKIKVDDQIIDDFVENYKEIDAEPQPEEINDTDTDDRRI